MPSARLQFLLSESDKSAKDLCAALGISQPTFSRLVAKTPTVVAYGPKSATMYTLSSAHQGIAACPMYRVGQDGMVAPAGTLVPVLRDRFVVVGEDGAKELHRGLPWHIQDVRPQGFLGARFARNNADLHLPDSVREWSCQHVLAALSQRGEDLPGNLILSVASLDRYLSAAPAPVRMRADYATLAEAALAGEVNSSSAGGEQPKFMCFNGQQQLLVKFSAPVAGAGATPAARRWADLLVCEAVANEVLTAHGIAAASTTAIQVGVRMYLESVRFDRTAAGRIGMVSLAAVDAEFLGQEEGWARAAEALLAQKRIDAHALATVRVLDLFGKMIANSDMHSGNLSFLAEDFKAFRLAPVYDMTPMQFAPSAQGEVTQKEYKPPTPTPASLATWRAARTMAGEFWAAVSARTEIGSDFRAIAQDCAQRLRRLDRAAAMLVPAPAPKLRSTKARPA